MLRIQATEKMAIREQLIQSHEELNKERKREHEI